MHYDMNAVHTRVGGSSIVCSFLRAGNFQEAINLLSQHSFKWIINNGLKVYFWEDFWHAEGPLMKQLSRLYRLSNMKHSSVHYFIQNWNNKETFLTMWSRMFIDRDESDLGALRAILATIELTESEDRLLWIPTKGEFSTKWFCLNSNPFRSPENQLMHKWNIICSAKLPPKIKLFLWKIKWGIFPTRKFLSARIEGLYAICCWCNKEDESLDQIFWTCEVAIWAWTFIGRWWSIEKVLKRRQCFSLSKLLFCLEGKNYESVWKIVVAATVWSIWLAQNEAQFSENKLNKDTLEYLILVRIERWGKATKILPFGNDNLWKVNPRGAITFHMHKISSQYWKFKAECYDLVGAVDGAWNVNATGNLVGGI